MYPDHFGREVNSSRLKFEDKGVLFPRIINELAISVNIFLIFHSVPSSPEGKLFVYGLGSWLVLDVKLF